MLNQKQKEIIILVLNKRNFTNSWESKSTYFFFILSIRKSDKLSFLNIAIFENFRNIINLKIWNLKNSPVLNSLRFPHLSEETSKNASPNHKQNLYNQRERNFSNDSICMLSFLQRWTCAIEIKRGSGRDGGVRREREGVGRERGGGEREREWRERGVRWQ